MAETDVLVDELDAVADDTDVTHFEEDDEPEAREGDDVLYDLGADSPGGV